MTIIEIMKLLASECHHIDQLRWIADKPNDEIMSMFLCDDDDATMIRRAANVLLELA